VPIGATYIYNLNFFAGFIVASITYYILCRIWPAKAVPERWTEAGGQSIIAVRLFQARDENEREFGKSPDDGEMSHEVSDTKLRPSRSFSRGDAAHV
jgi:hypothetical protein